MKIGEKIEKLIKTGNNNSIKVLPMVNHVTLSYKDKELYYTNHDGGKFYKSVDVVEVYDKETLEFIKVLGK